MKLFDAMHNLSLLGIAVLLFGLFFSLRKRSDRAKYIALGVIMGLNIAQHLLKCWLWPHLRTGKFGLIETAYNVCAFLILLCPFSVFCKSNLLKQFQCYVGTCAGICAPVCPFWFIGKTLISWEFLRFWTCHTLLFLSSFLPALWGMVQFRMKDGWKFGLLFLGMLGLILLNNAAVFALLGYRGEAFLNALYAENPVWMMGPPSGNNIFKDILAAITLPWFRIGERFIPIVWYALPVYAIFTALGYGLGAGLERLQHRKIKQ